MLSWSVLGPLDRGFLSSRLSIFLNSNFVRPESKDFDPSGTCRQSFEPSGNIFTFREVPHWHSFSHLDLRDLTFRSTNLFFTPHLKLNYVILVRTFSLKGIGIVLMWSSRRRFMSGALQLWCDKVVKFWSMGGQKPSFVDLVFESFWHDLVILVTFPKAAGITWFHRWMGKSNGQSAVPVPSHEF